jgi:hypothetical protein
VRFSVLNLAGDGDVVEKEMVRESELKMVREIREISEVRCRRR